MAEKQGLPDDGHLPPPYTGKLDFQGDQVTPQVQTIQDEIPKSLFQPLNENIKRGALNNPGSFLSDIQAQNFFSGKEGYFDAAIEDAKKYVASSTNEGQVVGAWVLREVDYWDKERERLLIVCANALFLVKYNFITRKLDNMDKIEFGKINNILIGELAYPAKSLNPPRKYGGIRIQYGVMPEMSTFQKWNPFNAKSIPWTTLVSHPTIYSQSMGDKAVVDVNNFVEVFLQTLNTFLSGMGVPGSVMINEEPIMIESYAGFAQHVHNTNSMGFFKDRNGVSF